MPRPQEYQLAQHDFDSFLEKLASELNLPTRHTAWTALEAYFVVRRAGMNEAGLLSYANSLPPLLAALAIKDWSEVETTAALETVLARSEAMQSLRKHHNFVPDSAWSVVDALVDGIRKK